MTQRYCFWSFLKTSDGSLSQFWQGHRASVSNFSSGPKSSSHFQLKGKLRMEGDSFSLKAFMLSAFTSLSLEPFPVRSRWQAIQIKSNLLKALPSSSEGAFYDPDLHLREGRPELGWGSGPPHSRLPLAHFDLWSVSNPQPSLLELYPEQEKGKYFSFLGWICIYINP